MNKKIAIVAILIALIAIVSVVVVVLNPFEKPEQIIDENGEEQEEEEEEPEEEQTLLDVIVAGTDPDKNEIYYVPMRAETNERLKLTVEVLEISSTGYVNLIYIDRYWDEGEDFLTSLWDTEFQLLAEEVEVAQTLDNTNRLYTHIVDHDMTFFLGLSTVTEIVQYHIVVEQTEELPPEPEPEPEPEVELEAFHWGVAPTFSHTWLRKIPVTVTSTGFEGYFNISKLIFSPTANYEYELYVEQEANYTERGFYIEKFGEIEIFFDLRINESGSFEYGIEICTEDGACIISNMEWVYIRDFPE